MNGSRIHKTAAGALCGALASAVACAMLIASVAPGAYAIAPGTTYYSSKQPYPVPDAATLSSYSVPPEGYALADVEMVARHGSRGLSGYKYDALLKLMGRTAAAEGGFVSDQAQAAFMDSVQGIIDANVENGYGMLTAQGAEQHQGIGGRVYRRDSALFDRAAAAGDRIAYETSGEPRATESGENFRKGFDTASGDRLSASFVVPAPGEAAGDGDAAPFRKSPDTLYFHKTDNPDGSKKTGEALAIAQRYKDFLDKDDATKHAEKYIEDSPKAAKASRDLLEQIFTPEFLDRVDDGTYAWYNTTTGERDADGDGLADDGSGRDIRNCAIAGDPDELMAQHGEDICGDTGKHITSVTDVAMDLYNLYIIAADMTGENSGNHTFDFDRYFRGLDAQDGETFAWVLDSEDFYEKGPGRAGQDETYRIAQPLLDDFFASIDRRAAGGDIAATFRFAHAETIMPFAALLRAPGSAQQAPDVTDPRSDADVFTYANNDWRGESVTPMAANIQWDVSTRPGVDPRTGRAYTPLIRMLYNEREVPFDSACTPVAEESTWYKESELKSCLGVARVPTDEDPRIEAASTSGQGGQGVQGGQTGQTSQNGTDVSGSSASGPSGIARTGAATTAVAICATVFALAGVSLSIWRRRAVRPVRSPLLS